jgi:hypothetical protein
MNERRRYASRLTINGRRINEVVVDPHYETKHLDMSDAIILDLVKGLDGKEFKPDERSGEWEFFMVDRMEHHGKPYRLVWCMRDGYPLYWCN